MRYAQTSRSTWACELKFWRLFILVRFFGSRSTWACELKYGIWQFRQGKRTSHAPRERVSWNLDICQEELKAISHAPRERVSWNTKCIAIWNKERSHAPRERVSWNTRNNFAARTTSVTLHVSVWVEMPHEMQTKYIKHVTLHVSVWVEILFTVLLPFVARGSRST